MTRRADRTNVTETSARADAQARLTALHAEYAGVLLQYLRGFTRGEPQAAEDLLQETMIRAWRRLDTMPACGEPTRRWLFTVARNVAIDAVRTAKARPAMVDLLDPSSLLSGEDTSETVVALQSLRQGFRSLSASHRAILTELYVEGRSAGEMARRLGVPVGTVKSRAHYALRSLRRAIAWVG